MNVEGSLGYRRSVTVPAHYDLAPAARAVPYDTDIAQAAALIADPTRAAMLRTLMSDRPLAAGELARLAGVSAATASFHLAKLLEVVAGQLAAAALYDRRPRGGVLLEIFDGVRVERVLDHARDRDVPLSVGQLRR